MGHFTGLCCVVPEDMDIHALQKRNCISYDQVYSSSWKIFRRFGGLIEEFRVFSNRQVGIWVDLEKRKLGINYGRVSIFP